MNYWEPPQKNCLVKAKAYSETPSSRTKDVKILGALKGDLVGEIVSDSRAGELVRLKLESRGEKISWVYDSINDRTW